MRPDTTPLPRLRAALLAAVPAAALALGGCATSAPMADAAHDPLETPNRVVFAVNDAADALVVRPAAVVYREVVPDPVRDAVQNVYRNLTAPLVIANSLLQGDLDAAGRATGRFMTNTILGLGGIADVAAQAGLPYEGRDFGQTLASWGVGEGPYLVLPLLGPSNARDALGLAVDAAANPARLGAAGDGWMVGSAAYAFDQRARLVPATDDLKRGALDHYAAVRAAHQQHRRAAVRGRAAAAPERIEFPD